MNCPVCQNVEMNSISIDGVQVNRCGNCGGHWLHHGELSQLANREEQIEPTVSPTQLSIRHCPDDDTLLNEIEFQKESGLHVDVCPTCRGIWLDAYELSQALTLLGRPQHDSVNVKSFMITKPVLDLLAELLRRVR